MKMLAKNANDYLALRKNLGFRMYYEDSALTSFVLFMEKEKASYITTQLAVRWAMLPQKTQLKYRSRRLSMIRSFAKYLSAIDPRTEIPPKNIISCAYQRPNPYIYNNGEISKLLKACINLGPKNSIRGLTYSTLFGLLSVTGLRLGEAINLDREDVDLESNLLRIRQTKFRKSRYVPIHISTCRALREYVLARDKFHEKFHINSFFVSNRNTRLTKKGVQTLFDRLSLRIGLKKPSDKKWPTLHDLRHTFAVRKLIDWYRNGANIDQKISFLSTYLGHTHPSNTYWYLSSTPELLEMAVDKLEKYLRGKK
jgi:integrase